MALAKAEALRYNGRPQEALDVLDSLSGAVEQTAEYLYQRAATVAALGGNPSEVGRAVGAGRRRRRQPRRRAVRPGAGERSPRQRRATPATCTSGRPAQFPTHVGTLLNLGVLYEDMQQYEKARQCYQRILDVVPDHPRARLFFKDADASRDMYYDEDARRRQDRLSQVLGIPVTDFELSVRSRNCLQKMGIMTLGDLTRTQRAGAAGQQELRRDVARGNPRDAALEGPGAGPVRRPNPRRRAGRTIPRRSRADEQAMLDRPIADLNLSVRARKCMVRLGLSTIGELVRRTGDDLLECKNFGVTSLNEVREKLTIQGLKLRGD